MRTEHRPTYPRWSTLGALGRTNRALASAVTRLTRDVHGRRLRETREDSATNTQQRTRGRKLVRTTTGRPRPVRATTLLPSSLRRCSRSMGQREECDDDDDNDDIITIINTTTTTTTTTRSSMVSSWRELGSTFCELPANEAKAAPNKHEKERTNSVGSPANAVPIQIVVVAKRAR